MTVEIILASVITFVIAFFLIDLTVKLSDDVDNAYLDTELITDKALIIKNIKSSLEDDIEAHHCISSYSCNNNRCNIYMTDGSRTVLSIADNSIKYDGGVDYTKKFDNRLSDPALSVSSSGDYYNFKISGNNIFLDEDYDMNIIVYNYCG